jgi:hypothetical protein
VTADTDPRKRCRCFGRRNSCHRSIKLLLDGQFRVMAGTTSTTAAQKLAEYLSNKNQPLGYCGLDASAKVRP